MARAAELDPGYVDAHANRAIALTSMYWLDQQPEMLRRAESYARLALSLDDHHVLSHDAMAYVAMHQRKFDLAGVHSSRAVRLNPNDILAAGTHAIWLTRVGKPDEALQFLRCPLPAFLIVSSQEWESLSAKVRGPHRLLAKHRDLYKNCDVVVVTNQ